MTIGTTFYSLLLIPVFSLSVAFGQNAKLPEVGKSGEKPTSEAELKAAEKVVESAKAGVEAAAPEKKAKKAKPVNSDSIRVFGWVEWCELGKEKLRLKARLDTGAKTSSLHAEDIELFEREGVKWVKFTTLTQDDKRTVMEHPLKRVALIKKAGIEELDRRYVVELEFGIDGIRCAGEFTLSERDHMNYPVLVGRNLISKIGLVDARRSFIADDNISL